MILVFFVIYQLLGLNLQPPNDFTHKHFSDKTPYLLGYVSWRRPKHCEYINEDEDNSPSNVSNKNHQASS